MQVSRFVSRSVSVCLPALVAGLAGVVCLREHVSRIERVRTTHEIAVPEAPKLDLLWVVDNSASMCQEQASLARNFGAMAQELAQSGADVNVAVVTTDVEDPAHQGRFQNTPATANHLSCDRACLEDAHCGGGCLCGVPHIRRCERKADCDDDQECVAATGSSIEHCAEPCANTGLAHEPTSDKCGAEVREQQVLTCRSVPQSGGSFCTLTPCTGDEDCNAGTGQRCLEGPDGTSYCRRFRRSTTQCIVGSDSGCSLGLPCEEQPDGTGRCSPSGQCLPPTCDCPKTLPTVLSSSAPGFERDFGCLATVGTKGDTFEKGLESMRKALEPRMTESGGPNEGFLRRDAHLGLVVLSDEHDCSDGWQVCDAGEERCIAVAPDGRRRGETEDDRMRCVQDSMDLDDAGNPVHYCRLPRGEASECEHFRDWLRPVGDYVDLLRSLKDDPSPSDRAEGAPCEDDRGCPDGRFCSRKARVCIEDRVFVAAIVGPKDYECVFSCPSDNPVLDCVADEACEQPCEVERGEGAFCADRVYNYNDPVRSTCTSVNGQAFNGRRYIDLVGAFGEQGIHQSICGEESEFRTALEAIGEKVAGTIRTEFCLPRPLLTCRSDRQCGEGRTCMGLDDEAARLPYCADEEGRPADLQVDILDVDGEPRAGADPEYVFVADAGPSGYGCLQFVSGGPGPGETVRITWDAVPAEQLVD